MHIVLLKKIIYYTFKVLGLQAGVLKELRCIEVVAGTELHGLFAERAPQRLRHIVFRAILSPLSSLLSLLKNNIIQSRTGKVSEQYCL